MRQGGTLRGSDGHVELIYGQLGLWSGSRLRLAVSYLTVDEARAAALAMLESRR